VASSKSFKKNDKKSSIEKKDRRLKEIRLLTLQRYNATERLRGVIFFKQERKA
jgi:hypothetical protein